jgi:hypothetical protein
MRETFRSNNIRKIQQRLLGVAHFSARALLIFVLAALVGSAFMGLSPSNPDLFAVTAAGQNKKKPPPPPPPPPSGAPTAPSNLRITGMTSSTVALAWDPSTDNSGRFIYCVLFSGGLVQNVPQTQTTLVWTPRLELGQTYTFLVYAVDFENNKSGNSNTVNVTIPSTPTPFTAPVITVTDIGVRHIALSWLATGGTPYIRYLVYKDGVLLNQQPTDKLADTFYLLQPATTYTFTVQARDRLNNLSPPGTIEVTTQPSNPNDVTPPTMPGNLTAFHYEGDREMSLSWTQSVDDFDAQSVIRYDVYVNGVLEDILIGRSFLQTLYGVFGVNTITVIAIDTAGNQSTAATITVTI